MCDEAIDGSSSVILLTVLSESVVLRKLGVINASLCFQWIYCISSLAQTKILWTYVVLGFYYCWNFIARNAMAYTPLVYEPKRKVDSCRIRGLKGHASCLFLKHARHFVHFCCPIIVV